MSTTTTINADIDTLKDSLATSGTPASAVATVGVKGCYTEAKLISGGLTIPGLKDFPPGATDACRLFVLLLGLAYLRKVLDCIDNNPTQACVDDAFDEYCDAFDEFVPELC